MTTMIQINDTLPKQQYIATEGQTLFSYNFPIFAASDLQVFRTRAGQEPDDSSQELSLNSDYTVAGVGEEAGGSITMLITINEDDRITLQRAMPYQRLSSYTNGRRLNAESIDIDFNSIILMIQQIHAYYEKRFVHYENTIVDDTANLRLPTLADGQFWKRNSAGIVAAILDENPDWSTLRSELANQSVGTDGSRLVGYQDGVLGSTTVHDAISHVVSSFGVNYAVDSGTVNHLIVNFATVHTVYYTGMELFVETSNYNTGASDINVDSLGVKSIKLKSGNPLFINNLVPGIAHLVYNGTNFILLNPEIKIGFSADYNTTPAPPNVPLANNTNVPLVFPNVVSNEGGCYSAGSFVAPVTGGYDCKLAAQLSTITSVTSLVAELLVNGVRALAADDVTYTAATSDSAEASTSRDLKFIAGDVVTFRVRQVNAGASTFNLALGIETFVSIKLAYLL